MPKIKFILKLYSFWKKSYQRLLLKVKQLKAKRPVFIEKQNKQGTVWNLLAISCSCLIDLNLNSFIT